MKIDGKKKLGDELKESLSINSKFSYYNGCTCSITKETRTITKEGLQQLKIKEGITKKHAFILQAVNTLGHATCQMVQQFLELLHRIYPKKEIPQLNYQKLTNELKYLSRNGMLVNSDYVTKEKNVILIYACTVYGYYFFKNCLEVTTSYDDNALFRAEHETFKRLGANSIALALAGDKQTSEFYVNGRTAFGNLKKIDGYTYAAVQMEKRLFVIEPIYFMVDYTITTDEEEEQKINNRLDKFESILSQYENTYDLKVRAVFCVENWNGLTKLSGLIKERYTDIYQNALYTSENILYQNGYDLDRSFIHLSFGEQIKMVPWKTSWNEVLNS